MKSFFDAIENYVVRGIVIVAIPFALVAFLIACFFKVIWTCLKDGWRSV